MQGISWLRATRAGQTTYPGGDPAFNVTTGTDQATRLYGTGRRPAFRRTSSSGPSKNVVQASAATAGLPNRCRHTSKQSTPPASFPALLSTPGSNNAIGGFVSTGYTRQVRVAGVPLFLKSPNRGCIDPTQETILNPAAWQDQTAGVPGSNIAFFNDFRGQRRPIISGGLGKEFRVRERVTFSLRAEFFNLLNQNLSIADPSTGSPQNPPTRSNGVLTGGFGFLNYFGIASNSVNSSLPTPRTGQLVARFEF